MRRKNITSEMMMDYISEGLLEVMRKKRYQKITVSDICERAGVNRSTYYRHFYTKEDVIRYYLSGIMRSYLAKYESYEQKSYAAYLHTMFAEFMQCRDELLMIHKEHLSYLLIDVLNECFAVEDISDRTEQVKTAYHIGGIYNSLLLWFSHDMKETPDEMLESALSFQIPQGLGLYNDV